MLAAAPAFARADLIVPHPDVAHAVTAHAVVPSMREPPASPSPAPPDPRPAPASAPSHPAPSVGAAPDPVSPARPADSGASPGGDAAASSDPPPGGVYAPGEDADPNTPFPKDLPPHWDPSCDLACKEKWRDWLSDTWTQVWVDTLAGDATRWEKTSARELKAELDGLEREIADAQQAGVPAGPDEPPVYTEVTDERMAPWCPVQTWSSLNNGIEDPFGSAGCF